MTCDCDHHETCAVCVPALHGAKHATPHEQLIDELRDSTIPKTEREHAAAREIERLRASLAAIHCRVCHGAPAPGMSEAIASECEHAMPGLKALRPNV